MLVFKNQSILLAEIKKTKTQKYYRYLSSSVVLRCTGTNFYKVWTEYLFSGQEVQFVLVHSKSNYLVGYWLLIADVFEI